MISNIMNVIVNKCLLAADKLMHEMHLQPGFTTYSDCVDHLVKITK